MYNTGLYIQHWNLDKDVQHWVIDKHITVESRQRYNAGL